MPCNSSFPAPKPLPGSKRSFPAICSRVNSGRVNIWKPDQSHQTPSRQVRIQNSCGSELFSDCDAVPHLASKRIQPKPSTHHDSSAVSACLNQQICKPSKTTDFRSKIPVMRKPVASFQESPNKTKWNSSTLIEPKKVVVGNMSPLPGKKKTLNDFMDNKHFRATPAPPTIHKPSIPVAHKKRQPVTKISE